MRMDRFFVRIQKITLKNFKNVKYGTVSLTNPLKKYKASVLGLYGQNGSGKTALLKQYRFLRLFSAVRLCLRAVRIISMLTLITRS